MSCRKQWDILVSYKEVIVLEFLYVPMADKPKQMEDAFQPDFFKTKIAALDSVAISTENRKGGRGITNFYFKQHRVGL